MTENHEVKIVTARTTSKEPRPIHSQNHYSTTRSQTPKKLQLT